jgi:hypothetical protein
MELGKLGMLPVLSETVCCPRIRASKFVSDDNYSIETHCIIHSRMELIQIPPTYCNRSVLAMALNWMKGLEGLEGRC